MDAHIITFSHHNFNFTGITDCNRRLDIDCGQIGTRLKARKVDCKIGPPAANAYAVDPVGVETIKPSDR